MAKEFREYVEHGWSLVPIAPGRKSPTTREWNRRENATTDPVAAENLRSAGLMHSMSGTCAIDVDNFPVAAAWLQERGIDLEALINAPDAVQITSGRADHCKLLYALPEPLTSKTVVKDENNKAALDFRCATAAGRTLQDVLPPSIHPDTGTPYRWVYDEMIVDWRSLPTIPEALHKLWLDELAASADLTEVPDKGAAPDELRELLRHHDPDMSREEWVKIGMALHYECDGSAEGLALWDEWSATSATKYNGIADLENCWRSFHDTPNSITVGHLRQGSIATVDEFPHIDETTQMADPWAQVEQKRRDRFKLVHIGEVAERDPPEWIVEGIIPKADLAMMYGAPGAGKSFVALDLAFSVATGYTWFNMKANKGPVVWIAAEAAGAMRSRAKAYGHARGVVLENTDLWVIEQTLSLMDGDDATALAEVMKDKEPALIIVDTLAAASGGANENSGADMNKVMDNCRKLHEATGALIMLVHHSGKDAARGARGWSGIKAAMHTEILISQRIESSVRIMQTTKQRDAIDGEQYAFKLHPVTIDFDGDGDTTSCVIEPIDDVVVSGEHMGRLSTNQRIVMNVICELTAEQLEDDSAIQIQRVYDVAVDLMPRPSEGIRDRRLDSIQRAIAGIAEKGYITVSGDKITTGSAIDEELNESPLSEM